MVEVQRVIIIYKIIIYKYLWLSVSAVFKSPRRLNN